MQDGLQDQSPLNWEDFQAIAVRRRRWIFLPVFVCWAAAWCAGFFLPPSYRSEALILVDQQQVPDQYVVPNITVNLQDRLASLTQQILSRTRLEQIIQRYHLYSGRLGARSLWRPRDPVQQMRDDIKMELVETPARPGEYAAFKMSYAAGLPVLAQQVNTDLTSLFVNENVKAQQQLSENTTAFLEDQVGQARTRLAEQEAEVAAFKTKHFGELPSQLEHNTQVMAGLQAQLQNTEQALDTARQQRLYLESLLRQYLPGPEQAAGDPIAAASRQTIEKELLDFRLRLEDLRSHYTDNHPDIVALQAQIAKAEKLQSGDATEGSVEPAAGAGVSAPGLRSQSAAGATPASTVQMESQLKANQLEIQDLERRERGLASQMAAYQARLNATPKTEQELADISLGYEEAKTNYDSLLQKQMQSRLATSLEQQRQGVQFRVVDPPSLPEIPSGPNRFRLVAVGLAAGVALGLALACFVEMADPHLRREKDLEGLIPTQVLVHIPRLSTPREKIHRLAMRWLEAGAVAAGAAFVVIGSIFAWYRG